MKCIDGIQNENDQGTDLVDLRLYIHYNSRYSSRCFVASCDGRVRHEHAALKLKVLLVCLLSPMIVTLRAAATTAIEEHTVASIVDFIFSKECKLWIEMSSRLQECSIKSV